MWTDEIYIHQTELFYRGGDIPDETAVLGIIVTRAREELRRTLLVRPSSHSLLSLHLTAEGSLLAFTYVKGRTLAASPWYIAGQRCHFTQESMTAEGFHTP